MIGGDHTKLKHQATMKFLIGNQETFPSRDIQDMTGYIQDMTHFLSALESSMFPMDFSI